MSTTNFGASLKPAQPRADNTENSWFGHPARLTINGGDPSNKS